MNPEYDATTDRLKQRLDETNAVITDWRQRVKKYKRAVRVKTFNLIAGIISGILVIYNISFGFIGFFYLDSGRDGIEMLLFGLTFAVFLIVCRYSLTEMLEERAAAGEAKKGAVGFLAMAESMAEKLTRQVADRLVGDVD